MFSIFRRFSRLNNIIRKSTVKVLDGRFAVTKLNSKPSTTDYFMITDDGKEITMIVEENKLKNVKYDEVQSWFKIIQVAVSVPFFAVGFLARITQAIAERKINVLVISTFSYDYLLIREKDLGLAIKALRRIGFPIIKNA